MHFGFRTAYFTSIYLPSFPCSWEWANEHCASKWMNEFSGAQEWSEQRGASEWVSGVGEQANGWASGAVYSHFDFRLFWTIMNQYVLREVVTSIENRRSPLFGYKHIGSSLLLLLPGDPLCSSLARLFLQPGNRRWADLGEAWSGIDGWWGVVKVELVDRWIIFGIFHPKQFLLPSFSPSETFFFPWNSSHSTYFSYFSSLLPLPSLPPLSSYPLSPPINGWWLPRRTRVLVPPFSCNVTLTRLLLPLPSPYPSFPPTFS